MYDITSEESFQSAKNWIYEVRSKAPEGCILFLWGGKADLEDRREVTLQAGHRLAKDQSTLFGETSAKINIGISEMYEKVAKVYIENNPTLMEKERNTITLDSNKSQKKDKKSGCKW